MTSTFTDYVVTPEYWRDSVTAATPYTVDVIPQSVFDGLADVEAGRVAPMWFRRSNAEHEPRAIASRAPCSCSAISSEVKP
jgi:hypothetical protein